MNKGIRFQGIFRLGLVLAISSVMVLIGALMVSAQSPIKTSDEAKNTHDLKEVFQNANNSLGTGSSQKEEKDTSTSEPAIQMNESGDKKSASGDVKDKTTGRALGNKEELNNPFENLSLGELGKDGEAKIQNVDLNIEEGENSLKAKGRIKVSGTDPNAVMKVFMVLLAMMLASIMTAFASFEKKNEVDKIKLEDDNELEDNEPSKANETPKVDDDNEPSKANETPKVDADNEPSKANETPKVDADNEPSKANETPKVDDDNEPSKANETPKVDDDNEPSKANETPKVDASEGTKTTPIQNTDTEKTGHDIKFEAFLTSIINAFQSIICEIMKVLESFTKQSQNIANNNVKASIDADTNNSSNSTNDNNNTKVVLENDIEEDSIEELQIKELKEVFEKSIAALENEDVKAFLETFHEDTPFDLDFNSESLEDIFKKYDLSFKITDFKVIEVKEDLARVSVDIVTRKVNGPDFMDNKTKEIVELKKSNGVWKIFDSELISVEKYAP
jgi:outer membrane biosynthesis protein TonB